MGEWLGGREEKARVAFSYIVIGCQLGWFLVVLLIQLELFVYYNILVEGSL